MSGYIGPSLPPGFATQQSSKEEDDETATGATVIWPHPPTTADPMRRTPPKTVIGPHIPRGLIPPPVTDPPVNVATLSGSYGPPLPPGFQVRLSPRCEEGHDRISPTHSESDSDGEMIGPMPSAKDKVEDLQRKKREIEAHSQAMRDKLTGKNLKEAAPKREEWMTELPPDFKPLGIGPRKFRTKIPEGGDRSGWTDTPADRRRKAEDARSGVKKEKVASKRGAGGNKEADLAFVAAREKELAKQVHKYNKEHRSESLMGMHRKRRAEELQAKVGVSERQPFDRERDLEAPRSFVTPAKRVALMKDSKLALDTKFQRGSRSFL